MDLIFLVIIIVIVFIIFEIVMNDCIKIMFLIQIKYVIILEVKLVLRFYKCRYINGSKDLKVTIVIVKIKMLYSLNRSFIKK